ncbi:hypothetical protein QR97_01870 [Streptomyces sp. PBH53]|nr:hypothetical protein QR97_01870 [Streptomyces sp. PBH53]
MLDHDPVVTARLAPQLEGEARHGHLDSERQRRQVGAIAHAAQPIAQDNGAQDALLMNETNSRTGRPVVLQVWLLMPSP